MVEKTVAAWFPLDNDVRCLRMIDRSDKVAGKKEEEEEEEKEE